jgi:cytochrome b561
MKNTSSPRYDMLSQVFHWVTAVAVGIAFVLGPGGFGRLMRNGVDPATHLDIVVHETLGLLVFALTALRLLWLAVRPTPPQTLENGPMKTMAKLAHVGLWLMLLAVPVTAMLTLASESSPLTLLGGFRADHLNAYLPASLAHLADWGDVHSFLGDAIVWLAGLHAAAALYHHFMVKDGVLLSMLPARKAK